jgi:hypothetical protein
LSTEGANEPTNKQINKLTNKPSSIQPDEQTSKRVMVRKKGEKTKNRIDQRKKKNVYIERKEEEMLSLRFSRQ